MSSEDSKASDTATAGGTGTTGESALNEKNNCRFYENKYPEVDEFVLVQVKSVTEMGAYVELLEYHNIEGMILSSEFSRRRIRSVNKLIRVGRQEVVVVLRVDKEKGYIDLSKRRVTPEDIVKCEEKYNKSKAVHSIMRQVAELCKQRVESLYSQFAWDLYKKYGHAYDAFKLVMEDAEKVLAPYKLDEQVKKTLIKTVERRMTPQAVKVRADLEISCFTYEGIDAVKDAIRAGESSGTDTIKVQVKLIAPPLYVMMTTAMDKVLGIQTLEKACKAIGDSIKSKGGSLVIKAPPRAVSDYEDKHLLALMQTFAKQNTQISGDEPDEEDMGM